MDKLSVSQTNIQQLQKLFWSILDQYKDVTKSDYERQLIAVGSFWLANFINSKYSDVDPYEGDTKSLIQEALRGEDDIAELINNNITYTMVQLGHVPVQLIQHFAMGLKSIEYDFLDILNVVRGLAIGKYGSSQLHGYYTGSTQLAEVVKSLVEIPNEAFILDPAAGFGTILSSMDLSKAKIIELCDMNPGMSIMSYIIWKTHNERDKVRIKNLDSLLNIDNWKGKVDILICEPPFGQTQKKSDDLDLLISLSKDLSELFVWFAIQSMSGRGKSFLVVLDSLLYSTNKNSISLRKHLIEEDLIEAIISLPAGILYPFTSVKCNLLILDKSKPQLLQNKIKFFEAPVTTTSTTKNVALDIDKLQKIYNSDKYIREIDKISKNSIPISLKDNSYLNLDYQNLNLASEPTTSYDISSKYFKLVSTSEVKDQGNILLPLRYLSISLDEDTNIIRKDDRLTNFKSILKSITLTPENSNSLEIQEGNLSNSEKNFKIILPKSISESPFDPIEYFDNEFTSKGANKRLLVNPAILVSNIGTPKATYFNGEKSVLISPSIDPYELETGIILAEYFLIAFREEYVQEQLKRLLFGSTLQRIRKVDFLNVKIRVPSIDKQKELIENAKQVILINKNEELRLLKERLQTEDKGFEVLSNFKHDFAGDLEMLSSGFMRLKGYLQGKSDSGESILLDEVFNSEDNSSEHYKLKDWLSKYESNIRKIIERLEVEVQNMKFDMEIFKPEEVMLIKLIYELIDKRRPFTNYKINVKRSIGITEDIRITIDKRMMQSVIDNLITNAIRHGFKDSTKTYNIFFEIDVVSEDQKRYASIRYSNDGEPFPNKFTFADYIERGRSAGISRGQGIGGDRINRIILKHNGKFRAGSIGTERVSEMDISSFDEFENASIAFEILLPIEN